MAERGDPDALALSHQRDRHARALPGLARPRRPLDEQVTRPERERRRHRVGSEQSVRRAALEKGDKRRVCGCVAVGIRPREAEERLADHPVGNRRARRQSLRKGLFHAIDAAQHGYHAVVIVDPDAEARAGARIERRSPDLVLLGRERHPVRVALSLDLGRIAVPLEPADRRPVAPQLFVVELRPAEPRPPLGPRLALVVTE